MTTEIVWSETARRALLDVYVAIGLHNPVAAERIVDRIESLAGRLAQHPRLGPRRPDIRAAVRMLVETPYLILYETSPDSDNGPVDQVEIITIVDGRRNVARAL